MARESEKGVCCSTKYKLTLSSTTSCPKVWPSCVPKFDRSVPKVGRVVWGSLTASCRQVSSHQDRIVSPRPLVSRAQSLTALCDEVWPHCVTKTAVCRQFTQFGHQVRVIWSLPSYGTSKSRCCSVLHCVSVCCSVSQRVAKSRYAVTKSWWHGHFDLTVLRIRRTSDLKVRDSKEIKSQRV